MTNEFEEKDRIIIRKVNNVAIAEGRQQHVIEGPSEGMVAKCLRQNNQQVSNFKALCTENTPIKANKHYKIDDKI